MAENGLQEVKAFSQLADLQHAPGRFTPSLYNNAYFFHEFAGADRAIQRILYQESEKGLGAYFDMGSYYKFVFSFDLRSGYRVPALDKKICCEFIVSENVRSGDIRKAFDGFLVSNGFEEQSRFFQMRYAPDAAYRIAAAQYEDDIEYLSNLGMHPGPATPSMVPEIEALIRENISEYDTMNYPPRGWARQLQQQNITCILKQNEIAAIHCYAPDGSRTVVAPSYKGLHLGIICKRLFHAQGRWKDEKKSIYTWVRPDNTASMKMLREIAGENGLITTEKMRYRYVKPAGATA